jgi:acetyl esterase/lipase
MTIDGFEPRRLLSSAKFAPTKPFSGILAWKMKRLSTLCSLFVLCLATVGAQTSTRLPRGPGPGINRGEPLPTGFSRSIQLWPGAAPLATGNAPGDIPRLFYYPASAPGVGSAVIVLPGGSYVHEVMEKEGAAEAKWLAAHGVAAFILQYRVSPWYRYPAPMLDGSRAVRYIRAHASEFNIDPNKIGVWGFSAGGHLAGYLATEPAERDHTSPDPVERLSAHPDFAIFSYARLSMDPSIPRSTSMEPLLGDNPTPEMLDRVSYARHVTRETSPSFIYSTTADQTVNSLSSTEYYDAMKRAGVPVELHIFELGPHGTGMGQNLKGIPELEIWPTLLEHWMQMHAWMPALTDKPLPATR